MRNEIEKIAKEFNLLSEGERHFWGAYNSYREEEEHSAKIGSNDVSILPKMIAYKLLVQNIVRPLKLSLMSCRMNQ